MASSARTSGKIERSLKTLLALLGKRLQTCTIFSRSMDIVGLMRRALFILGIFQSGLSIRRWRNTCNRKTGAASSIRKEKVRQRRNFMQTGNVVIDKRTDLVVYACFVVQRWKSGQGGTRAIEEGGP